MRFRGMLSEVKKYLVRHNINQEDIGFFGQNQSKYQVDVYFEYDFSKVKDFDVRLGDTLRSPAHVEKNNLLKFDRIVSAPPFSLARWGKDSAKDDLSRFIYGIP